MGKSSKINWALIGILVFSLLLSFSGTSYAETDVTDKVELVKSRLRYDRRTNTSYLDVSLKNISQDVLLTPIKVVIDSISSPDVTVANADGITDDGKPYFEYLTDSDILSPGDGTATKKWTFSNAKRSRFSYSVSLFAVICDAAAVIGPEGGVVEVTDPTSSIYGAKIEVPEGIVNSDTLFTISRTSGAISPPNMNTTVSEGLQIKSSFAFEGYVVVTCPLNTSVSGDDALIISYYDEQDGGWGILPVLAINYEQKAVKFAASHFTDFFAQILMALLPDEANSGFNIKRDCFNENVKHTYDYLEDHGLEQYLGGICSGFANFSLWYYLNRFDPASGQPGLRCLWNEEKSLVTAVEAFEVIKHKGISEDVIHSFGGLLDFSTDTPCTCIYLMYQLAHGKPEVLGMKELLHGGGHAIVVIGYKKTGFGEVEFHCYDVNNDPDEDHDPDPMEIRIVECKRNLLGRWSFDYPGYDVFFPAYVGGSQTVDSYLQVVADKPADPLRCDPDGDHILDDGDYSGILGACPRITSFQQKN